MGSWFDDVYDAGVDPQLTTMFGIAVSIQRGTEVRKVTAYRGDVNPRLESENGQSFIELHGVTWSIPASEYIFAGVETKPLPGDLLKVNNETLIASPMAPGNPVWRYEDASQTKLQIHYVRES